MAQRVVHPELRLSQKTVSQEFLKTLPRVKSHRSSSVYSSDDDSITLNKLNLSGKIYGRGNEVAELFSAYESIFAEEDDTPRPKLVLISGRSGTGKSMVAQKLCTPVRQGGGFFVTGKFDLQQRVEPYTAFVAAFTELCNAISVQSEEVKDEMVEKIRKAVGSEGKVLTDMISNLKDLIGTQDATASSGNMEARNRLHFLLRKFMRAVCSSSHPLVLVLDDLQWADAASLELLETLVTDSKNLSLLIVATVRENEVDSEHVLSKQLETIEASQVTVRRIQCENLDLEAVNELVSDALRSSEEVTKPLADVIHRKTLGNGFFVVQFLRRLYDDELLTFNFGAMKWTWDENLIQSMDVTDNIVDLMMDKIQKLPSDRQFALQVAACLGQTFRVTTLTLVMEKLEENGFYIEDHTKRTRRSVTETLRSSTSDIEEDTKRARQSVISDMEDPFSETQECERADGLYISQAVNKLLAALRTDGVLEDDLDSRFSADAGYSFVHDQIQNAALNLIPDAKRPQLQLLIGRTLLEDMASEHRLSLAVDLCNRGASSIPSDDKERIKLAKFNLLAGEKAMKNAAYIPAAMYFETGLMYLEPSTENEDLYTLVMQLLCTSAEAEYCNGNFDAMEKHLDRAIAQARTFDDKIRPYMTLILSCGVREDRRERGIDTAFYVLEEMGMVKFPKNVSTLTVLTEIIKTKRLFKGHTQESLSNLFVMQDENRENAMRILDLLVTMTYFSRPAHLPLVILRMIRWSVKYGVCKHSPPAFATYGMVLCGSLGDLKTGFMCGEVALTLLDRLKCKETMSRTIFLVYGFVHHWTKDEQLSIKPFLYGHQVGMETGDIEQAMYNLDVYGITAFYTSKQLDVLEKEWETYCQQMSDYKQESILYLARCKHQLFLNLLGRSEDPLVLTGEAMNQEEMRKLAKETNNRLLEVCVDAWRLPLAYIFGEYELADELSGRTREIGEEILVSHIFVPRHLFYAGMTAFALARSKCKASRKQLRYANLILRKMKKWAQSGNVSCLHMIQMFEAELAVVKRKRDRATRKFNDSISSAARAGYLQDRALAHERAGLFFLDEQDNYWASYHFERSIECYDDWGAKAKVDQLVEKYAAFITQHSQPIE